MLFSKNICAFKIFILYLHIILNIHNMSRPKKNVISKEKAEEIVKEVYNVADFCRAVG
jgi:hypothetical protein